LHYVKPKELEIMAKVIILKMTEKELIALTDCLDTFSALSEGLMDDNTARNDLKKVDKMLKKNGYKLIYN
jgi:hypothetical protein